MSGRPAPPPALVSTITSWPFAVSSRTVDGTRPPRHLLSLISLGTPTSMMVPADTMSLGITAASCVNSFACLVQNLSTMFQLDVHVKNERRQTGLRPKCRDATLEVF